MQRWLVNIAANIAVCLAVYLTVYKLYNWKHQLSSGDRWEASSGFVNFQLKSNFSVSPKSKASALFISPIKERSVSSVCTQITSICFIHMLSLYEELIQKGLYEESWLDRILIQRQIDIASRRSPSCTEQTWRLVWFEIKKKQSANFTVRDFTPEWTFPINRLTSDYAGWTTPSWRQGRGSDCCRSHRCTYPFKAVYSSKEWTPHCRAYNAEPNLLRTTSDGKPSDRRLLVRSKVSIRKLNWTSG